MTGDGADDATATPAAAHLGWRRRRRYAAASALTLVAALSGVWVARRPLAEHFIDKELARRGVPARYTVSDLGFGRQRLTNVVIGDPARPDLTADWIETDTAVGLSGAHLKRVRAGHVLLSGRWDGRRVLLGTLDRLLPAPSGKPFALPTLDLEVADARLALVTPAAPVMLALSGKGRLDGGFQGRVRAVADDRVSAGPCRADIVRADLAVAVLSGGRPRLTGPISSARADCGTARFLSPRADVNVTLAAALDGWTGNAKLSSGVMGAGAQARLDARADFRGAPDETTGTTSVAGPIAWPGHGAAAAARIAGRFQVGSVNAFQGRVTVADGRIEPSQLAAATRWAAAGSTTPLGPLAIRAAEAVRNAGRQFDGGVDLLVQRAGDVGTVVVDRVALSTTSGLQASFGGGRGLAWQGQGGGWTADGQLDLSGGGAPTVRAAVTRTRAGAISGTATLMPYAAGGARLALAPVDFRIASDGSARVQTVATVSGPLANGRVDDVRMPLSVQRSRSGAWRLDSGCTRLGWRRVAAGGLVLGPATVPLCATDGALVSLDGGQVRGGARIARTRLTGRLGSSALDLRVGGATFALGARTLVASDVGVRIGDPARPVRIDAARLDARADAGGVRGRFAGASGQIGAVPLLLSDAVGTWRLAGGNLSLEGDLKVADSQVATPRFHPLGASGVQLTLVNSAIHATGALVEPETGTRVGAVTIDHGLASGRGVATITVPSLSFTPDFQPDRLTRLTFGVIADVRGTVSGDGRVVWGPEGVSSTGVFRTAGTDLAAAFGPVTGLATEIRFTDLLALQSAPGQVATVASINPGIPVTDGVVRYQTLPDSRVQVEGAIWPFAGGTLSLAPTLLDFGGAGERLMTFTVDGVAADRFLQQFDFDNLQATGTFDGTLPMVFDAAGGRIEGGRLTVRPGGGTLAYLGDISRKDLGFWGNLAFGALRSLRYRNLSISMNGPLAGEMVTDVRFSGVTQGQGATSNILIRRLQRLPFVFNVRIKAPFRGLIDSAQSFYDPKRLIDRNLPALLQQQNAAGRPVQPPASEPKR